MTEIERFKTWAQRAPERQLMAVGSEESPEPMAMQRVARQLGVSTAALAAASAATLVAPTAGAATSAATATFVKSQGLWGTTLVKGLAMGLGLGMSVVAGTAIFRAPSPGVNSPPRQLSPAPIANATSEPARSVATPRVAVPSIPSVAAVAFTLPKAANAAAAASVAVARVADSNAVARVETREIPASSDDEHASAAPQSPLQDGARKHTADTAPTAPTVESNQHQQPAAQATASANPTISDPRLAREIASLDQVRGIWQNGDAAQALLLLRNFQRREGYLALQREALLTSIDLLLALGERAQAAAVARQLLQSGVSASERAKLDAIVSGAGR